MSLPPRVDTPESLFEALCAGRDLTGDIAASRWGDGWFDPAPGVPGRAYVRRGAFFDRIDRFDAVHFGISAREADAMDPQHRFLLEVAWDALEDAGIAPDRLSGSLTGVFVGIMHGDYRHS